MSWRLCVLVVVLDGCLSLSVASEKTSPIANQQHVAQELHDLKAQITQLTKQRDRLERHSDVDSTTPSTSADGLQYKLYLHYKLIGMRTEIEVFNGTNSIGSVQYDSLTSSTLEWKRNKHVQAYIHDEQNILKYWYSDAENLKIRDGDHELLATAEEAVDNSNSFFATSHGRQYRYIIRMGGQSIGQSDLFGYPVHHSGSTRRRDSGYDEIERSLIWSVYSADNDRELLHVTWSDRPTSYRWTIRAYEHANSPAPELDKAITDPRVAVMLVAYHCTHMSSWSRSQTAYIGNTPTRPPSPTPALTPAQTTPEEYMIMCVCFISVLAMCVILWCPQYFGCDPLQPSGRSPVVNIGPPPGGGPAEPRSYGSLNQA